MTAIVHPHPTDLDVIQAVRDVRRVAASHKQAARKPLRKHGLELGVYFLLDALTHHLSAAARPTELAREVGVTTGAITRLTDRAALLGFVQRKPADGDRRGCLVTATRLGIDRHAAAAPDLATAIRAVSS